MSARPEVLSLPSVEAARRCSPSVDAMFDAYEEHADPSVCLHLPADECDHRVFRCRVCCVHNV